MSDNTSELTFLTINRKNLLKYAKNNGVQLSKEQLEEIVLEMEANFGETLLNRIRETIKEYIEIYRNDEEIEILNVRKQGETRDISKDIMNSIIQTTKEQYEVRNGKVQKK